MSPLRGRHRQAGVRVPTGTAPWLVAAAVAMVMLAVAVRARLLDVPLDRDTGEYAYAGQLLLRGVPPYGQVNNMKMPGTYAAYATILGLFGETRSAVHLGLLIVNAATIALLYLLARRLLGNPGAAVAAACFAVLSLGQEVRGIFAKAEHFVVLFAVAGLVVLVEALERDRRWLVPVAGLLAGLGFLMKQHGAAFVAFGAVYLVWRRWQRVPFPARRTAVDGVAFVAAALLPLAMTCALLWRAGVLGNFRFWTVTYAWEYVSDRPLGAGLRQLVTRTVEIAGSSAGIWLLAAVGVVASMRVPELRRHGVFLLGLAGFSVLAVCPGLYFRPHYFLMLLPAVALGAGAGANGLQQWLEGGRIGLVRTAPVVAVVLALAHGVHGQREMFFAMTPEQVVRTTFRGNPFAESIAIGEFIRQHSAEADRVAILGSEPEIYFYARRRSATGYIYAYPLMEDHPYSLRMQEEMIDEIEQARPRFLVIVNHPISWLRTAGSETRIFEWSAHFQSGYRRVALIESPSWDRTVYRWGARAAGERPRSSSWIAVMERLPGG